MSFSDNAGFCVKEYEKASLKINHKQAHKEYLGQDGVILSTDNELIPAGCKRP
jgi:hypothetical protein